MSQPQGHSAAGRIMSMRNSSATIGNQTRDLLACSTVPQPMCATTYPTPSTTSVLYTRYTTYVATGHVSAQ